MQWLIDLIIEAIGIPPTFIDRGDPATSDFSGPAFTRDGAWHDLDLSAIIPAGATAVLFAFEGENAGVAREAKFREKGNVNDKNRSRMIIQIAMVRLTGDFVCPLDANRFIQYNLSALGWLANVFTVKGWWL